ncbi:MAG TPA: DUF4089 domain-containing protein [Curvibacter sp.]|nr:DUF4089 domain-containing protein [Curvibacter sp.]|tara:strand:+ start:74 stop:280 length:207 start_codon:yes stop_codon:yes gene_type:complete
MSESEALSYVIASAAALNLPLDEAQALRVAANLQRTAAMAAPLMKLPLAPEAELAEIYCPAPPRNSRP